MTRRRFFGLLAAIPVLGRFIPQPIVPSGLFDAADFTWTTVKGDAIETVVAYTETGKIWIYDRIGDEYGFRRIDDYGSPWVDEVPVSVSGRTAAE
jgi:hypothetical protein